MIRGRIYYDRDTQTYTRLKIAGAPESRYIEIIKNCGIDPVFIEYYRDPPRYKSISFNAKEYNNQILRINKRNDQLRESGLGGCKCYLLAVPTDFYKTILDYLKYN